MSAKKFYETAEFKKLNKEWAKKLAESGFNDLEKNEDEYVVRPEEITTKFNDDSFGSYVEFVENTGLDYYQFCHQILREFDFESFNTKKDNEAKSKFTKGQTYRSIFELYTEGKTEREIANELQKIYGKKFDNSGVHHIIKHILDQNLPKPKSNS